MAVAIPTVEELKAKFAALSSAPDTEISAAIKLAAEMSSSTRSTLELLAAHITLVHKKEFGFEIDGGSGELMSESLGTKSNHYKTQAATNRETFFTRTAYGRTFLELEKRTPSRVVSVRVFG